MNYQKKPTTIDQQVTLLKARGMSISDENTAKEWLEKIGYYRLSAYWLPFEITPENVDTRSRKFKPNTSFLEVTNLYVFDQRLRLLVFEAIETVEIHIRSRWTYHMANKYGAHAHTDSKLFKETVLRKTYDELIKKLKYDVQYSKELFIEDYKNNYTNPKIPTLWHCTEVMTLGSLQKWVSFTKDNSILKQIANEQGFPKGEHTDSILQLLNEIRNICAHHSRLWNRKTIRRVPVIKRIKNDLVLIKDKRGEEVADNRLYNVLVILLHLTRLDEREENTFKQRMRDLINQLPSAQLNNMGFPEDWQSLCIWKD